MGGIGVHIVIGQNVLQLREPKKKEADAINLHQGQSHRNGGVLLASSDALVVNALHGDKTHHHYQHHHHHHHTKTDAGINVSWMVAPTLIEQGSHFKKPR